MVFRDIHFDPKPYELQSFGNTRSSWKDPAPKDFRSVDSVPVEKGRDVDVPVRVCRVYGIKI